MESYTQSMSIKNVHIITEYIKDPKFKTEMCKNWEKSSSCPYNNKCRFAHGKEELMAKEVETNPNYRIKDCLSFFKYGFCSYGRRCCFRHDERRVSEANAIIDIPLLLKLKNPETKKRLSVFEEISVLAPFSISKYRQSNSTFSSTSTKCSIESIKIKKNDKKNKNKKSVVINEVEDFMDLERTTSEFF